MMEPCDGGNENSESFPILEHLEEIDLEVKALKHCEKIEYDTEESDAHDELNTIWTRLAEY